MIRKAGPRTLPPLPWEEGHAAEEVKGPAGEAEQPAGQVEMHAAEGQRGLITRLLRVPR